MCFKHFNILSGVGELLGGIGGSLIAPGIGTAIGAELGGTLGGVAGGQPLGRAALSALPGAAIGGIGAELAPSISSLFSGTTDAAAGGTAPVTGVQATPLPAPGAPAAAGVGPLGGPGVGAGGIAAPPSVGGDFGSTFVPGGNVISAESVLNAATGGAGATTTPFGTVPAAGGGAAAGAATGGTAPAGGFDLSGALSSVGNFFKANPNLAISGLGLGYEALSQRPLSAYPGYSNMINTANQLEGLTSSLTGNIPAATNIAGTLNTQGQQLGSYLQTGTLPPGEEAALSQAAEAQKASIRSRYAAAGMTGSSSEAADLANVDTTMAAQAGQLEQGLLSTGVSEQQNAATILQDLVKTGVTTSGLSADIYSNIMNTAMSQDQTLAQAIAMLAGSAARPTINVTQPAAA